VIRSTLAVGRKELRQMVRDPRSLLILLFMPAVFLLLYGYALNFDTRNIALAVQDRDRSAASRDLVSSFVNSGYFDLTGYVDSDDEITALIDRNLVRAVLVVPPGFERDVRTRVPVTVQVIVDGDNANTASTVTGYAQAIITGFGAPAVAPALVFEPRIWYNPELRSTLFLVPGLIAFIAMITAVVSTALTVVREKERGTMEQVRMAPLNPASFILGKTLPYLVLSFAASLLIVFAAMLLFDMPMRGSWSLLLLCIAVFLVGAQAQGLLISTVAQSQQVAMQLALLSSFLPTFLLSGFVFPLTSMPAVVQAISHVVPARYFLVTLRGIVLKGAALESFWTDLAALAVFACVALALASLRLRREWA
jgi:ABC-2 type transport system permease protein